MNASRAEYISIDGAEPTPKLRTTAAIVQARVIGGFRMRDAHRVDVAVSSVHVNDPAFADRRDVESPPGRVVDETVRFFEDQKALEGKTVEAGARLLRVQRLPIIRDAIARHRERRPR